LYGLLGSGSSICQKWATLKCIHPHVLLGTLTLAWHTNCKLLNMSLNPFKPTLKNKMHTLSSQWHNWEAWPYIYSWKTNFTFGTSIMYTTSFNYLLTNSPKINYFTSCKASSLTLKHRYLTFNFGMTNLRPHQLSINLCSNEAKLKVEKGRCKKHTTCGTSWILLGSPCKF
jgi:hypothetical protein